MKSGTYLNSALSSLKLEQITTKILKQNSNSHEGVELWAKTEKHKTISGISDAIFPARHPQKSSRHVSASTAGDGAICSKNRKIVPYHGTNPRDYEVREHIPVPHDNLFQSILSFAPLFLDSSPWPRGPWSEDQMSL